jgi:hypothetical protein
MIDMNMYPCNTCVQYIGRKCDGKYLERVEKKIVCRCGYEKDGKSIVLPLPTDLDVLKEVLSCETGKSTNIESLKDDIAIIFSILDKEDIKKYFSNFMQFDNDEKFYISG